MAFGCPAVLRTTLLIALTIGGASCVRSRPVKEELGLDQKFARLMKLEDERALGEGEIVERLADPHPRVRARAALALGRIGDATTGVDLVRVLADPEPPVRVASAFALGELDGPLREAEAAALRRALEDTDPDVRGRAAEAIAKRSAEPSAQRVGGGAPTHQEESASGDTITAITESLLGRLPAETPPFEWGEDLSQAGLVLPHPDLRLSLFALARLKSGAGLYRALALPGGDPRFMWWPAAWSASRIEAPELLPVLLGYVTSKDPYVRMLAARGLSKVKNAAAGNAVLRLLEDDDEKVRIEAVRAAGALKLKEATPRLLQLARADTPYSQVESVRALGLIADRRALDPLLDRLTDPSPWIRGAALRSVALVDRETFFLLLSGMDLDPDWRVRAELADALGENSDTRAQSVLRELAADRDFRVRPRALAAAVKANLPGMAALLLERLSAEDPFERAAAAEGVQKLKPEGGVLRLGQALEESGRDVEPDARLAILDALAAYGKDAVLPAAARALEDKSYNVRVRAAGILKDLGQSAVTFAGPVPGRSLAEYLDLLSPRYTPQAFIRTEKGVIELELFVLDAPLTVLNFMKLARGGFYNGQTFHRVVPNFVIQAGDPRGDSNGGPAYTIRCEINTRPYLRGTVGMALSGKDTGGSQFFITHLPQPHLDGGYTVFGRVTRGIEVVDRIEPGDVIREIFIWDGATASSR